jgi:hypothetical protein
LYWLLAITVPTPGVAILAVMLFYGANLGLERALGIHVRGTESLREGHEFGRLAKSLRG